MDRLPAHPNSAAIVSSIGLDEHVHADFGSGLWEVQARRQGAVPVDFEYASESDGRRYPLPRRVSIEGGRGADGDRHVLVVDRSRCRLYELFAAYPQDGGTRWSAGSGAIWNLRSPPRPSESTSQAAMAAAKWGEIRIVPATSECPSPGSSPPPR